MDDSKSLVSGITEFARAIKAAGAREERERIVALLLNPHNHQLICPPVAQSEDCTNFKHCKSCWVDYLAPEEGN